MGNGHVEREKYIGHLTQDMRDQLTVRFVNFLG
jgi:hypothetical protein